MEKTQQAPRKAGGFAFFDAGIVAFALLGLWPAAGDLAEAWQGTSYLSYGAFVVPISLWIAWTRRRALGRLPSERQLLAAPLLLLAVGLARIPILFLQGIGLVLGVWACVWLIRGFVWVRELRFPLAYLAFVIPPPDTLIAAFTYQLRLIVTEVGLAILHLFALPVAREGSVIVLPTETLFVAEACSGINSIFSMLPAAVLLGHLSRNSWPRRLLLVLAVVPIAMFWNLVRVLAMVVGSLRYGAEQVTGALHEPTGLLTFTLGCATLVALDVFLERARNPRALVRLRTQPQDS